LSDIPKILIVDDEQETRKLLAEHLTNRIECLVLEASNGYEALEYFKSNSIDLLLLDIKMPGISGTEVIEKARQISKEVPIIVISKWDGSQVSQHVQQCGADDYIPKPFSLKVVRAKVEERLKSAGKFFPKQPS
jgi:two-component system, OmpR family, response regulator ResD